MPIHNIIYDDADFALWKREVQLKLQDIYDRTSDQFIWDILVLTKQGLMAGKMKSPLMNYREDCRRFIKT